MKLVFFTTGEINGSSYLKIGLGSSARVNFKNGDKYCFIWSKLASLRPFNNGHLNRVSNCRQNFNELNIQGFDFTKGFKCSDMHKFERLNNLSIDIYDLNFSKDDNKWKHKQKPIEISKNITVDRVIHLGKYKNHYNLMKKVKVFFCKEDIKYICRRCLYSYTTQIVLINHTQNCDQQEITSIKISTEPYVYWKTHFHKNPITFRFIADF